MNDSLRANPMDVAADRSIKEFTSEIVAQMSAPEKRGAQKVIDWIAINKSSAGYRRLCRYLITIKVDR